MLKFLQSCRSSMTVRLSRLAKSEGRPSHTDALLVSGAASLSPSGSSSSSITLESLLEGGSDGEAAGGRWCVVCSSFSSTNSSSSASSNSDSEEVDGWAPALFGGFGLRLLGRARPRGEVAVLRRFGAEEEAVGFGEAAGFRWEAGAARLAGRGAGEGASLIQEGRFRAVERGFSLGKRWLCTGESSCFCCSTSSTSSSVVGQVSPAGEAEGWVPGGFVVAVVAEAGMDEEVESWLDEASDAVGLRF